MFVDPPQGSNLMCMFVDPPQGSDLMCNLTHFCDESKHIKQHPKIPNNALSHALRPTNVLFSNIRSPKNNTTTKPCARGCLKHAIRAVVSHAKIKPRG